MIVEDHGILAKVLFWPIAAVPTYLYFRWSNRILAADWFTKLVSHTALALGYLTANLLCGLAYFEIYVRNRSHGGLEGFGDLFEVLFLSLAIGVLLVLLARMPMRIGVHRENRR